MLPGQALDFISKNLTAQGISALSTRDFSGLTGLGRGFDDLQVPDPELIVPAAVFAVLPALPTSTVATEFGDRAGRVFSELQKTIQPATNQFFPIAGLELHRLVDAACGDDEDLSYAAQGVLAGRVAAAEFKEKRDLETALNERVTKHRSILDDLRQKVAGLKEEPEVPLKPMWLITFSIDVVGSTEGKTRMLAVTKDDKVLQQAYEAFHKGFMIQEDRFYRNLLSQHRGQGMPPALSLNRLYVVKGIGDEIWGVYLVDEGDTKQLREATERLMLAGLDLVKGSVIWGAKETDKPHDPIQSDEERSDAIQHPLKMCVDLIEDGYELGGPRFQFFAPRIPAYIAAGSNLTPDEAFFRLNVAHRIAAGTRTIQSVRPDYLGHEVDRFFRVSKAAMAMVVSMGECLFTKVNYSTKLTAYPGLFRADWSNTAGKNAQPLVHDTRLYVQEELTPDELKGIGYSYRVYHFIERGQLGLFHNIPHYNPHMVEKTLKTFNRDMFLKLFTPAGRQRYDDSVKAMGKADP